MRDLVKTGYDTGKYVETYARTTKTPEAFEKALCDELIKRLPKNAKILDLGCGVGLPYDAYFAKKGSVTGIDLSEKHIQQAKKNLPSATFKTGDFFEVKGKYDAVVSFYAIFHIPREEHKKLFKHIHSLLKKNGHILITLGAESMKCDVKKNFAGASMAWSSYSIQKNKKLVEETGFEILLTAEDYRTEKHLFILARKK